VLIPIIVLTWLLLRSRPSRNIVGPLAGVAIAVLRGRRPSPRSPDGPPPTSSAERDLAPVGRAVEGTLAMIRANS